MYYNVWKCLIYYESIEKEESKQQWALRPVIAKSESRCKINTMSQFRLNRNVIFDVTRMRSLALHVSIYK